MTLKTHQPPLTVEAQVENLKQNKLIISDEQEARNFLNKVSYFRFIKAYSLGLKDKNGPYRDQTSFDLLKELYLFNSSFRHLLFPLIEDIEVTLRCRLGNYFCMKYGVLGYLDESNFFDLGRYSDFKSDIEKEISYNSRAPFVKNFKENYDGGKLPFYAVLEVMTFGTLSKLFQNLKTDDRKAISQSYNVSYTYFQSWIESLAYVRNLCAHYGRLYNAKLTKSPTLYEEYKHKGIHNYHVFAVILSMKHILPHDKQWFDFVNALDSLFHDYNHVRIDKMGFPTNWKELLLS